MTSQPATTVPTDRPRLTIDRLRELLRAFLPDYLRIVEPESVNFLDFEQLVLLDTDDPAHVAATVFSPQTQQLVTVLVLLQEGPLPPTEIGQTIAHHLAQFDLHVIDAILLSVVFLEGGRPGVNLETAPLCRLMGQDLIRIYYTAWGGLRNLRAEYYLNRQESLAWALAPYSRTTDPAALRERCYARIAAATGLDEERRALLLSSVEAAG